MSKSEIIVIRESTSESIIRDCVSAGTLIGLIGVGVVLDSQAMQWVAGIMWMLWMLARGLRIMKDNRFTIEKARLRLDEIEVCESNSSLGEGKERMTR